MKICAAQTRPLRGAVESNIAAHEKFIEVAASMGADGIFFPELSLTGYDAAGAKALATSEEDTMLHDFQICSDALHLTIGVGMPIRATTGIRIGLVLFQPNMARQVYAKRYLHQDELPYFIPGETDVLLTINDRKVAPAICYESLLPEHAAKAAGQGAAIYMASVAKAANGVAKGYRHYPEIARVHNMTVVMANCVGPCDTFESVGQSAVWNSKGNLVAQLDDAGEGLLLYDTVTDTAVTEYF